jgi:hypothetical protein
VYRGEQGTLLASLVSTLPRLGGRGTRDYAVQVRSADAEHVTAVTLQTVGGDIESVPFSKEHGAVQFDLPDSAIAAVAELHLE